MSDNHYHKGIMSCNDQAFRKMAATMKKFTEAHKEVQQCFRAYEQTRKIKAQANAMKFISRTQKQATGARSRKRTTNHVSFAGVSQMTSSAAHRSAPPKGKAAYPAAFQMFSKAMNKQDVKAVKQSAPAFKRKGKEVKMLQQVLNLLSPSNHAAPSMAPPPQMYENCLGTPTPLARVMPKVNAFDKAKTLFARSQSRSNQNAPASQMPVTGVRGLGPTNGVRESRATRSSASQQPMPVARTRRTKKQNLPVKTTGNLLSRARPTVVRRKPQLRKSSTISLPDADDYKEYTKHRAQNNNRRMAICAKRAVAIIRCFKPATGKTKSVESDDSPKFGKTSELWG